MRCAVQNQNPPYRVQYEEPVCVCLVIKYIEPETENHRIKKVLGVVKEKVIVVITVLSAKNIEWNRCI